MPNGSRPDLDPVLRRAFMAPAIAEWTRVLGKPLIVSTTEDDDTAAANCAVEVVMAVDGAVRGKVTYTLAAQTVTSIASASGDGTEGGPEQDPLPAIDAFFKPIATRAREMLQSSGLGCTVSTVRVRDVRGHSYSSPVTSPRTVHMVTQPSHKDPTPPDPVSLWFDLETIMAPVKPGYTPIVRTSRLEIVDESGTARAVVSTLADGSPHIVFADRDGRIRAAISLAKDGQPRILFLDEMGRRILDLPHAGSSTSQVASQPTPPRKPAAPQPPPPPPQNSGFRPGNPPQTPPQRRPDHPQAPHR
jgi:hypothetical protein